MWGQEDPGGSLPAGAIPAAGLRGSSRVLTAPSAGTQEGRELSNRLESSTFSILI